MKRALVASHELPQPDRDSGGRRLFDFLCFLREGAWAVDFVTTHRLGEARAARALQRLGIAVHDGSPRPSDAGDKTPPVVLEQLVRAVSFDLALLAFWPVAELYLPLLRKHSPGTRVLVDSVDLHFLRFARRLLNCNEHPDTGLLDAEFGTQLVGELNTYLAADGVLTISPREAALLSEIAGERLCSAVVPDCEELKPSPVPISRRTGILLLGSYTHAPNVDALEYLCREILPRMDRKLLEKHPVRVVGAGLDKDVRAIAEGIRDVQLVGWVPSTTPYLEQTRISILPLRYGAGTKRKMIQALLTGTPTVSTSIGAEGLDLEDGKHVLIADDPKRFARGIERLLEDDALCSGLAAAGLEHAAAGHSRKAVQERFGQIIAQTLTCPAKPPMLPEGSRGQYSTRINYLSWQTIRPVGWHARNGVASAPGRLLTTEEGVPRQPLPGPPVRLIAFYLPQYHPIPENDRWWGEGFTDWRNVARAQPLFPGHHQPQLPADLGFYDLRLAETRAEQAELARRHGIHGFCYYHYWFHGKRLLERPFNEVLDSGRPDSPFCLCWANEPWSRRWDGSETDVLQAQSYSAEDDLEHIRWLLKPLSDPRAIQIDGRPVFLVYQGKPLPDPARTTDLWRREAERAGLKGLYLLAVETGWDAGWDATQVGFDAKVLFQPQFTLLGTVPRLDVPNPRLRVFDYQQAWPVLANPPPVPYRHYDTVFPSWDNTPRKGEEGWVVHNGSPAAYQQWLELALARALERPPAERIVFINAWNEWAEGCHLEPDRQGGLAYLEAIQKALIAANRTGALGNGRPADSKVHRDEPAPSVK